MLDDLRKLFSQAWASFLDEVGRREPEDQVAGLLGAMRREMVEVRAQLPLLEQNYNAYPILRMTFHGVYSENTVWQGIVSLWDHQEWLVAVIVFVASILVPLLKLSGLLYLVASVRLGSAHHRELLTRIYRFIDVIGPWAMLDVFLLAILVALVKLGQLATVVPGPGLVAFTGVVVLTMLASAAFDPKLIWEPK